MRLTIWGLLCSLAWLPLASGQGMQPVVAIHDSELTRALESMPASSPTPTGPGTTGFQWWPTDWHYFVMPEAAKEALRSDGTVFTVVGDSNIVSGGLLANGAPKYPIVISLASEAIRDDEIAQFTNYVAAGGFLFVGSSAFTRNTNGASRGDFAFANALGVHMVNANLSNWQPNSTFTKQTAHRVVNDMPGGALTWRLPSSSDEISWGTSPSHPFLAPHDLWSVKASDATVLASGDSTPFLLIKPYGKGFFIYEAAFQPLLGHGGFAPGMYAYMVLRRSIEWAFASANVPVPKLSPWPYAYDAAFMIRHDLEDYTNSIANIEASAQIEFTNGAKGDYYFCTGTLRDDASPKYNTNAIVASLRRAVTNYGTTLGPHNGGLKNPGNSALVRGDYDYWHWGPDEVLDLSPAGYANGKAYASASLSKSFQDIESWLSGITNGVRGWVACYFNATREDSIDLQASLNVKIVGDDKIGPFPHWTLSTRTPGKRYAMLTEPVSDWFVGGLVAQSLEPWHPPAVHTSQTMHNAVDFYYNLGALINIYSHTMTTGLGDAGPLTFDYLTYSLNPSLHPRVWSSNALGVYQWWLQRSNAQVSATFAANGNQSIITLSISGARDPNTSVELLLPNANAYCNFQVVANGVVASGSSYRNNGQTLKLKVGTTITNAVISYYPNAGTAASFTESFDGVTPPGLPSGWTTTTSGAQSSWTTENTVRATLPNAAFSSDAASVGVNEIVSPLISLPSGQTVLTFQNNYNLESTYDGGVLEIKIGAGSFADILTAGGSFNNGGYNSSIDQNYSNPLAGRAAWSGNSSGFVSTSVNLPLAGSGQTIQLKWRCGTDSSNGGVGWWIDSVALSNVVCACCGNNPPVLPSQSSRTIAQFSTLTVTNSASDPESPPQTLSYQLLSPPAGASIDNNGIITWRPGVGQGPSTNTLTTIATDNGAPPLSATNSFTVFVTVSNSAPLITTQPQNQTNVAGTTATFSVGAAGNNLSYQWFKNALAIGGATSASLLLANVSDADMASYSVTVSNAAGSVTSSGATLTVLDLPVITSQPVSRTNNIGSYASFAVAVNGAGITYQWSKNGSAIPGATGGTLNLFNVLSPDAGSYSVVVGNQAGNVNSAAATLTVVVTGSLPGQLYVDSFARSGISPWVAQSGSWSIANGGLQGGPSTLQSYGHAYLTNSWTDYAVQAQIQFPAGAFGGGLGGRLNPATGSHYAAWIYPEGSAGGSSVLKLIKFQTWTSWSYNGVNSAPIQQVSLPGVGTAFHNLKLAFSGKQIAVYYDGALMISAVDTEATTYTSGAINANMWTASSAYAMAVDNVVVSSLAVGDSFAVNQGSVLNVPAPGVLANDTGVYGTGLTSSLVSGVSHGALTLNSDGSFTYTPTAGYSGSDGFTYQASIGQTNLGTASVTILVNGAGGAPVITSQPTSQTNNAGTTANFSVGATGAGLSYQWLKNGNVALSNGGNVSGATSSSLSLANVGAGDVGTYSVVVSNTAGSITSSSATLTVLASPLIVTQPVNQTNNAGTTATFSVSATGTSLNYQWIKNGAVTLGNGGNVSGATSSSLSLANVAGADAGSYSVVVSNTAGSITSSSATLSVVTSPLIVTQPVNQTNNAGTTATFSVSATGTSLNYQWIKNGAVTLGNGGNVSGATSSSLSLANVAGADAGSYSVVVSNTAGSITSSSATLSVVTSPLIVTQPVNQTNNAGTTATFSVSATGTSLNYQWIKNGTVTLSNGGNVSGATSSSLSLANVAGADAGSYSVVVSNAAGSITSSSATLTVVASPLIVTQPLNQTNNAGTTATFSVSATGTSLNYQWIKNGTVTLGNGGNVSGATSSSLSLANVAAADAGSYSVVVSNTAGSITSSSATLTVLASPLIVTQPVNQTNNAGTIATFSVSATGTSLNYQWIKNGTATLSDGGNVSGATSSSLSLANVAAVDAASYSVVVSNTAGSVTSSSATLTVVASPLIVTQPLSLTNNAGTTATFTVTATGGALIYQWLKNGTNALSDGGTTSGAATSSLSISNLTTADAGAYSVIVSNTAGTVTSDDAVLAVIDFPVISSQPTNLTAVEGAAATFSVAATGSGLTYQWLKNGTTTLVDGGNISGSTASTLSFSSVVATDAGSYSVIVSNSAGSITSASATLAVITPPSIVTQPLSRTNSAGTTASFNVSATGSGLAYQWIKNGTTTLVNGGNISGATSSSLSLANVSASDAASYSVVVSNSANALTSSSATLTVVTPPSIVGQPSSRTNNAGTTATFTVSATGTTLVYQWVKNGTVALSNGGNVSGATSSTLSLASVVAGDAGTYSVIVSNSAGSLTSSQASLTVISPPLIVTQPVSQTNTAGTTAIFNVTATGPSLSYRWIKNATNNLVNGGNVSGATTAALNLSSVTATDAGNYTVLITNTAGSVTSAVAVLTVTTPTGQLFTDDFSRTTLPPWVIKSGTWSITNGVLKNGSNTLRTYGNLYLTNVWTDYSVQAQFQFPVGAYGGGLGARLNPTTGSHYAAWIYPENSAGGSRVLKLVKFQTWTTWGYLGVSSTPMQQVTLAAVGTNAHTLKLTCSGSQIGVYYDGTLTINAIDAEAAPYQSGGVSIDLWTDATRYTMSVDNVVVTSVPPGTPLLRVQAPVETPATSITSVSLSNGNAVITWTAVPGMAYRLQFTDDAASTNWFDVAPDVLATGQAASATDVIGTSQQRFYRVLRLP